MIIKTVAIGNKEEAFIEKRIGDGVNVLYSKDNNKGKTVIMQSISYALGASDMFPDGIEIKEYYVYLECEINGNSLQILRKRNTIMLIHNEELNIFDTVSEFKHYFHNNIKGLPVYIKDEKEKIVDFPVYYELSFIPQDKRNPSNIINKTGNNKVDFLMMIASMKNYTLTSDSSINELKNKIKDSKARIRTLKKKVKFLNENEELFDSISQTIDQQKYEKITKKISELDEERSNALKKRTRETNRLIQLQTLLSELNSLNRKIDQGNLICADCGSDKVIYAKKDIYFDTTNSDVRRNVINAIQKQVNIKVDIIAECKEEIDLLILKKRELVDAVPNETFDYLLYKREINDLKKYIIELEELQKELRISESELEELTNQKTKIQNEFKTLKSKILSEMNRYLKIIEENISSEFKDIFTKTNTVLSGSTENVYYFCRSIALSKILNHDLPIAIDSFRDGEISTLKEDRMIDIFLKLGKQVVLSSTLKDEEYDGDKYESIEGVNVINYESVENFNLLQEAYVREFVEYLDNFHIVL